MSEPFVPPEIDWGRVKTIALHLRGWMKENNYELVDIERAAANMRSPLNLPPKNFQTSDETGDKDE